MQKKKSLRVIDRIAQTISQSLKNSLVLVKKSSIKTWHVLFVALFVAGVIAAVMASRYSNVETVLQAAPTPKQTFPRLGQYKNGSSQNYGNPAVQAQIAKLDLIFIDFYPGWGGSVAAKNNAINAIKARNPHIIILDYHNPNQVIKPGVDAGIYQAYQDKLNSQQWWVYINGTSGAVASAVENNFGVANFTDFVPPDANGDRWNAWYAKQHFNDTWQHVPGLDGTWQDNFKMGPKPSGDYNRDGRTDSPNEPWVETAWRQGIAKHAQTIRTLLPGKYVTGNIGNWGFPDVTEADLAAYDQLLDGGTLESYNVRELSPGWQGMMNGYRKVMSKLKPPKLLVLGVDRIPANDYKSFRYFFASTLLDDGYFGYQSAFTAVDNASDFDWFDEYDLNGTSNTSWLGTAVQSPQTDPWQNGVYKREFQNGMALVNPKGNGTRTVTVGPGWKRINGDQAPSVNNGQVIAAPYQVTLADRDGLLLIRNGAVLPIPQCSDTVDNDGDAKIDYPADPGCTSLTDDSEVDAASPALTVSLTAPTPGTIVSGLAFPVTATASAGAVRVEFLVDGVVKGTDTSSPFSFAWDTTNSGAHLCGGAHTHTLAARAFNATSNVTSASVSVNMDSPFYCATYNLSHVTNLFGTWLTTTTPPASFSPADINTDRSVNARDLGTMMNRWQAVP